MLINEKSFPVLWPQKDVNRRKTFPSNEVNKIVLKSLLYDRSFDLKHKIYWNLLLVSFSSKSSISSYRTSCFLTGSGKSIYRMFMLNRIQAKSLSSFGFISGMRKSSF